MFWMSSRPIVSMRIFAVPALILTLFAPTLKAADAPIGDFEAQADVGTVEPAGSAHFDPATKQYRVKSAGENIWAKHDDFHFLYSKVSGDVTMSADITLSTDGKVAHRKGGCMIRQSLEPDAAYVDVVVHGDGSIAIQYRSAKGEITSGIKSTVKAPATVRLERRGETFTTYVTPKDEKTGKAEAEQLIGSVKVALADPVYAGLAVTSHDAKSSETAVFSNVTFKNEAAKPVPGK
jgi:hypothetical protein